MVDAITRWTAETNHMAYGPRIKWRHLRVWPPFTASERERERHLVQIYENCNRSWKVPL